MKNIYAIVLLVTLSLCNGAILPSPELSKLAVEDESKQSAALINKDLETSASDRTFLLGKDYSPYGYGGSYGGSYGYGNYPGGTYGAGLNKPYYPNSVYRGYQTGIGGVSGVGQSGWGYYGSGGYGGLANYGGTYGNGAGGYGYEDALYGGRGGYNRWNSLDGYGGYSGGYGGYQGGYSNYPYGNRGYNSYGSLSGYPSGYRGYS